MAAPLVEITGVFLREIMRWDDTILGEIDLQQDGARKETVALGSGSQGNGFAAGGGRESRQTEDGATRGESSRGGVGTVDFPSPGSRFSSGFDLFRNPGTKIKGPAPEDDLVSHCSYRFYGRWENYEHPKTGEISRTFAFRTFVRCVGFGRSGIVRYLQDCPHVGPSIAGKLWDRFQSDAVRILREDPEVAATAIGSRFSIAHAEEAAEHLKKRKSLEGCTIDLIDLLDGRGFPRSTAQATVAAWGNRAAQLIRRDPYCLMKFRGCGWLRTDAMSLDLGLPPHRMKRQALAGWYTLASDTDGNTWGTIDSVKKGIRAKVGGAQVRESRAIILAKRAKIIDARRDSEGRVWLAEGKRARQEAYVLQKVCEAMGEKSHWPEVDGIVGLTGHQQQNAVQALRSPICLLTGSPGTGKSYLTAALVRTLESRCGVGSVGVACPTGKAARRLGMAFEEYGCDTKATTIHSMLGVESHGSDGWSFRHREGRPLPQRYLFVDEFSMVSVDLFASLLAARGKGTQILAIGDPHQLPPIQHGAPLRDLISAGIPYGNLTEIRRNAGTIVEACAAIRDQKRWQEADAIDISPGIDSPKNLKIIEARSAKHQIDAMLDLLDSCKKNWGIDPVWGSQIMTAVNKRSELSRVELNKILQRHLNSSGQAVSGCSFRVGDKVICTDNGFYLCLDTDASYADERGKCFVANGEFGEVVSLQEKFVVVKFSLPERAMKFSRGKNGGEDKEQDSDGGDENEDSGNQGKGSSGGCAIELAYATTVHKLQGSEVDLAIPMLDVYAGARRICRREWAITGLSRGKKLTLPIGTRATLDAMCRTAALPGRKTFLGEDLAKRLWGDLQ